MSIAKKQSHSGWMFRSCLLREQFPQLRMSNAIVMCGAIVAAVSVVPCVAQVAPPEKGEVISVPVVGKTVQVRYAPAKLDAVKKSLQAWLTATTIDDRTKRELGDRINQFQENQSASEVVELAVQISSAADLLFDRVRRVHQNSSPEIAVIADLQAEVAGLPDSMARSAVSQWAGRKCLNHRLYDEASAWLELVDAATAIDPAAVWFGRAVCQQQLLQFDAAKGSLKELLEQTDEVPERYRSVAVLMNYELKDFEPESLAGVSRMMSDVERRLSHSRTGEIVLKREDDIVAALDELIKKAEAQMGGGGGGGGGSQQQQQQSQGGGAATESRVKGTTGPGAVDKKNFKSGNPWGQLPAKQRAQAQEQISRDFPAHYRDAIEEYTRVQATRAAEKRK